MNNEIKLDKSYEIEDFACQKFLQLVKVCKVHLNKSISLINKVSETDVKADDLYTELSEININLNLSNRLLDTLFECAKRVYYREKDYNFIVLHLNEGYSILFNRENPKKCLWSLFKKEFVEESMKLWCIKNTKLKTTDDINKVVNEIYYEYTQVEENIKNIKDSLDRLFIEN